jgi:pimeloyl-ACP methyl ester carboxylesterase
MERFFIHILIISLGLLSSGCFSRFVMTEKELKEYYKNKSHKPTFFTVQNDSVKLFCATAGADTLPPLLLIHGAPGAWYGSRNLMEDSLLISKFHVIAVDRLGYNKSRFKNKRRAVTSIETQAIAAHEALRLNRSRKTGVVMGSSYGAPIAANMAILYPNDFHRVVMLAGALDPGQEKFWWFHKFIRGGPINWMLPRFMRTATKEKFTHVKELKILLPKWTQLQVPVTVVQGGADEIVKPGNFEFAKKQLKNKKAEFIFLPNAGHLIRWQYPGLVKNILLQSIPDIRPLISTTSDIP